MARKKNGPRQRTRVKRLLILQHVPSEILGTLNTLLKGHGFRIRYVNFGRYPDARPVVDRYNGLIVLGGPMHVHDLDAVDAVEHSPHLATEVELIQHAIAKNIPVLGVCLGAQLIAKALGASVRPNQVKEIGWYKISPTTAGKEDPLVQHFGTEEKIFQWHSDTFSLPEGAVHLASSPTCPHQAFRYGTNVYGFQFHLEVDEALIERWLSIPLYQQELSSLQGRITAESIRRETAAYIQQSRQLGDRVFRHFLDLFQLSPRREALASR
jgi:GMP synthase (glutamine-hydrolysing)